MLRNRLPRLYVSRKRGGLVSVGLLGVARRMLGRIRGVRPIEKIRVGKSIRGKMIKLKTRKTKENKEKFIKEYKN